MKQLNKGALFTDIHWGRYQNSDEHNQDCTNFVQWFKNEVRKDPEIDHIWFLGDWHEHRAAIHAFTLQASYQGAKLLDELGLPVYMLVGNHDLALRNKRQTFTTEHFGSLKNFVMLDTVQVIEEIHGGVLAIPYLTESEYPTVLAHNDVPVAMGHLELKGFKVTGTGNVMDHGPEAGDFFKNQKKVFSGHFHQRQSKGNIHFIGNAFPMDFSDANDNARGFAVYDFKNDDLKYVNWPDCPRYIRTKLSTLLDDPKSVLTKGARVKVEVDEEITFNESNAIKEKLQEKYSLREITLEEKLNLQVELTDIEKEVDELHLESTTKIIQELIRRIKPDEKIDTELLLEIYNSVNTDDTSTSNDMVDVKFIDMTLSNFQSYGGNTTTINLNFDTPTLILGKNYDSVVDGQVDSNGAGKSTILNGLLLAIYGKNLVKMPLDKQINNQNKKNMLVTTKFVANGVYYMIERYRKNRALGGDGVRLYRNEVEPVFTKDHDITPDSVANADKAIARIIGIPYEMFIRIVVFSARHEPFLSLPASHASQANQRDIIEELFGLTELSIKADAIKDRASDTKRELDLLKNRDAVLDGEYARHDQHVVEATARRDKWYVDQQNKIDALRSDLEAKEKIDVQPSIDGYTILGELKVHISKIDSDLNVNQISIQNLKSTKKKHDDWESSIALTIESKKSRKDELSKIDFAMMEEALEQLKEFEAEFSEYKVIVSDLTSKIRVEENTEKTLKAELRNLEGEVKHLSDNKCPYCSQNFADSVTRLEKVKAQIIEIEGKLKVLAESIAKNTEAKKVASETMDSIEEDIQAIEGMKIPRDLSTRKAELATVTAWLEDESNTKNPFSVDGLDDQIKELEGVIAGLNTEKSKVESKRSMAEEFILPQFKSMSDIDVFVANLKNAKGNIEAAEDQSNPYEEPLNALINAKLPERDLEKIDTLDKLVKHQNFLVKLLTKKDSFIRKALLNRNIPLLNTRLQMYLSQVGLQHQVAFNDSMGVDITQFGAAYDYEQFSSGQMARVNICLAFAFRDVLQSRFGKTNLCILDECLDVGLGSVGVVLVAKMVKSVALASKLSMFVITHKEEITAMFDDKLEIELRNGFSSIAG